jgi:hypothetical protein
MRTRYLIDSKRDGNRLSIETTFETVSDGRRAFVDERGIERQRRNEFEAVDSLVDTVAASTPPRAKRRIVGEGGDRV